MSIVTYVAQALSKDDIHNLPTATPGEILHNTLGIVYWVGGVVAVIVIIIAGYMYVTSSGDAAVVARAKNTILYGIIGLVVIALAFIITQFVAGSF